MDGKSPQPDVVEMLKNVRDVKRRIDELLRCMREEISTRADFSPPVMCTLTFGGVRISFTDVREIKRTQNSMGTALGNTVGNDQNVKNATTERSNTMSSGGERPTKSKVICTVL